MSAAGGRFSYIGSRLNKPVRMEQAIIEIGPHVVKFRGVDGFWVGVIETGQIPRDVLASVLSRVEQKNVAERERVVRFMMDMGWSRRPEKSWTAWCADFPQADLKERAENARQFIAQAEASDRRGEVAQRRKAQQYQRAAELLKTFGEKGIPTELQLEARDIERQDQQQHAADQAIDAEIRRLSSGLPPAAQKFWKEPVAEVTKALEEAPDAVRDRFAAWRKAKSEPGITDQASFALAMSSYVCGADHATRELTAAEVIWKARDSIRSYLPGRRAGRRQRVRLLRLNALPWAGVAGAGEMVDRLELLAAIIELMPPLRDDGVTDFKKTLHHRVEEPDNEPTEYAVKLPPEYHPLRSYPAVVVLHSGPGPDSAIDEWAARGRSAGLHPDRAGVHRRRESRPTTITRRASRRPPRSRFAMPASATRSTAIGSSPPARSSGATWPGIWHSRIPISSPASS